MSLLTQNNGLEHRGLSLGFCRSQGGTSVDRRKSFGEEKGADEDTDEDGDDPGEAGEARLPLLS